MAKSALMFKTGCWRPTLLCGIGLVSLLLGCLPGRAQTQPLASSNESGQSTTSNLGNPKVEVPPGVRAEQIRTACIQGRRCVCGRVLKVFPTGVLVESGYPNLLRDSLHGAWHLPATVATSRPTNLVESLEPDSLCVGTAFLTDLPKLRGAKIQQYDYVVLHSFPAGEFTYKSVGDIKRTVRRFSGGLETAVRLIVESEQANKAH